MSYPAAAMPALPTGWKWVRRPARWVAQHPHGWGYSSALGREAQTARSAWKWQEREVAERQSQAPIRAFGS